MKQQFIPFVSVIIPVFNDFERLKTCLEALENQTYPKKNYEVVVVDNASDKEIKSMVSQFSQAIATYESRPSSYAARNKGIFLAKGSVLAFTDSDCIPASDWIEKGVGNLLQVPDCGLVAGQIKTSLKNSPHITVEEYYDITMMPFNQQKFIEESRYGATANLFTFRSVVNKIGSFDQTLKSSGDREWGQRVFSSGYKQLYADDVCVTHPARSSLQELQKKIVRIAGGHQDLKRRNGYLFSEFLQELVRDLCPPFRIFFRIYLNQDLKTYKQKIKFTFLLVYGKHLKAWERVRIQLGGISTRG